MHHLEWLYLHFEILISVLCIRLITNIFRNKVVNPEKNHKDHNYLFLIYFYSTFPLIRLALITKNVTEPLKEDTVCFILVRADT